jgi:hypothetical protein
MCNLQRISSETQLSVVVFASLRAPLNGTAPDRPSRPSVTGARRLASCFCRKFTGIAFSPDELVQVASPLRARQCHRSMAKVVTLFLPKRTTPNGQPQAANPE